MENIFDEIDFDYKGRTYFVTFTASYDITQISYNHNCPVGEDMGPDEYEFELDCIYDIYVSKEGQDGIYEEWEDWRDDKDFSAHLHRFCTNIAEEWDGE